MRLFISLLKSSLSKHPCLRQYLRRVRFRVWEKKVAFRSGFKLLKVDADPNRILWVDPYKIVNKGVGWPWYDKLRERGRIVGGDWDLNTMPFEDLDVYQSLKARFIYGAKWEDTSFYKSILDRLARGEKLRRVRNKDDLDQRCEELDCLFDEIRKCGYQAQQELLGTRYARPAMDEVTVRIGRSGEILFEDGRHRLAIAKLLSLPKIPVMVTWRHKEWYLFRAQILDYARRHGGKIYQPITHPDLSDIPAAHDDTRFQLIRSNMPIKGGTLLDIGANWGYFCHKFDEEFHCYAVEKNSEDFYFLNKLRLAERRKFTAVHKDIFELWEQSEFDVVLALDISHHFLKTADQYEKLVQFLRRLRTRVMFFEAHLPDEIQMQGAYRNLDNEEFVRFISENTGLTQWECIGHGEDGRPIYKLTRG